jgi:hypothetical protein
MILTKKEAEQLATTAAANATQEIHNAGSCHTSHGAGQYLFRAARWEVIRDALRTPGAQLVVEQDLEVRT